MNSFQICRQNKVIVHFQGARGLLVQTSLVSSSRGELNKGRHGLSFVKPVAAVFLVAVVGEGKLMGGGDEWYVLVASVMVVTMFMVMDDGLQKNSTLQYSIYLTPPLLHPYFASAAVRTILPYLRYFFTDFFYTPTQKDEADKTAIIQYTHM